MARNNPETNSITIKPETANHMAEQFSWVSLPCCSSPRRPFSIKSFALSVRVSPQTIHFLVLYESPLSGLGRGSHSGNICSSPDGPREYHTKLSKLDRERQTLYDITYMWNLKNNTNEPIYKTETDS